MLLFNTVAAIFYSERDIPVEHGVLGVMSELGELAKEILVMTDYGSRTPKDNNKLKIELGDVFFSVIILANKLGVDLNESLDIVLEKYEQRLLRRGSPGSGNN